MVMFIGLNPSTANENTDDPTIKRVRAIANNLGHGGVYMLNLFAYISPYPDELFSAADPLGDNDVYLKEYGMKCAAVVFAWGNFNVNGRDKAVAAMFDSALALRINKNGSPQHPLYIPGNVVPVVYK